MGQTRVRKPKKEPQKGEGKDESIVRDHKSQATSTINGDCTDTVYHSSSNANGGISLESLPKSSIQSSLPTDIVTTTCIEVKDTDTKGQAVFATCKIQPGTLILCEPALVRLTQAEEDTDKGEADLTEDRISVLEAYFGALSRSNQKSYLKLFDSKKSDFTTVKSIYYSNCYNLSGANKPSKSSLGGSCIGLVASRINHSCIPNVQFSYNEDNGKMLFHTIKPIPKGREITSNYNTIYELRAQRQRRQMLYYGFKCDCEACEPLTEFWARSDERRRAMIEAKKEVQEYEKVHQETSDKNAEHVGRDAISALERLETSLIKEGLIGVPLVDLYKSMARWADRLGNAKDVVIYMKKELDVSVRCYGEQSPRVDFLRRKLQGFE